MRIRLSDQEAAIFLGATLMHWGVPFRRATKHDLSEQQQSIVDAASEKLIAVREAHQRSPRQEIPEVDLSNQEAALIIAVVEDCLKECVDDPTELRLQMHAHNRQVVETLLERIRPCLGSETARRTSPR
jgi:hypothetical protein